MDPLRVAVDGIAYGLSPYGGLITYWDAVLPRLARKASLGVVEPHRLRAPLPRGLPCRRQLRSPQVFLSTYYTPAPVGLPSVVVVHDTIVEDGVLDVVAAGDPASIDVKRTCMAAAARIVVPSEATRAALERHYPDVRHRVDVVPHGVDTRFQRPLSRVAMEAAVSLLRAHGVGDEFVLHVGGRTHYKDFVTLIAAVDELRRSHPSLRLVAVGSETALHDSEVGQPGADEVALMGYVSSEVLTGLYRAASVVASASRAEGFGLPIAEAAATNTPVVCSDLPAFREVAAVGTRFFPPGDRGAAAAALRGALAAGRSPGPPRRVVRGWDASADGLLAALRGAAASP